MSGVNFDHLDDGSPVDRGAGWLAPYPDDALRVAAELGVSTYKTWVKGAHLLIGEGRTRRYTGLIPQISPLAVLSLVRAQWKLDFEPLRPRDRSREPGVGKRCL